MKQLAKAVMHRLGIDVTRYLTDAQRAPDMDADAHATRELVRPYTMTGADRIYSLIQAVRHVVAARVPGAFVECGVWRGGSMMAVADTLRRLGVGDRDLYLYDTYEGMTAPTDLDVCVDGSTARSFFDRTRRGDVGSAWCDAPLDEVRRNMASTGYPAARCHYVQGKVEDTVPGTAPEQIALLRLDTDWYESTRHELRHLFPRIAPGGMLIVDDYGFWSGSRKAVDEYFAELGQTVFLHRVDSTARLVIKQ